MEKGTEVKLEKSPWPCAKVCTQENETGLKCAPPRAPKGLTHTNQGPRTPRRALSQERLSSQGRQIWDPTGPISCLPSLKSVQPHSQAADFSGMRRRKVGPSSIHRALTPHQAYSTGQDCSFSASSPRPDNSCYRPRRSFRKPLPA